MSEDNRLSKIQILIQQKKFVEAEKILSDLLSQDPNNIHFLGSLAEVNMHLDKLDNANSIIDNAIGISPDSHFLYYIKSHILIQQDNFYEAQNLMSQAIELDSYNASYLALLANIKLGRKQFSQALEIANQALEIDAENLLALNTRSSALNKLNRSAESYDTIKGALRGDPNNAYTHANYGWNLLEQGDHKKALEHFKEALTNDPTSKYAQAGMLEALKATNSVYRMFLKYAFFMSNLPAKFQWGVLIAFIFGLKILKTTAINNEEFRPVLVPIIIIIYVFAFSTWIFEPIGNLFLRFNKYGQLLLDKKEKMSSAFVAASLGVFVAGIFLYLTLSDDVWLTIAVFGLAMSLPLGTMFSSSKNKNGLLIYTITLGVVGIVAIGLTYSTGVIINLMSLFFIIGFVGFQWVANFMLIKENDR